MALSETEQLLLEQVKNMLDDKAELGLSIHKDDQQDKSGTAQWERENIEQQFALDANDLTHHQGITAAFKKVHDYKNLDNYTFNGSFAIDLKAQGIPKDEIEKALDIAMKVAKKCIGKTNEADAGWHPQLDEVLETSNLEE